MAARFVRDEEAAGSNPATPTTKPRGSSCGMAVAVEAEEALAAKFPVLLPRLNERPTASQ